MRVQTLHLAYNKPYRKTTHCWQCPTRPKSGMTGSPKCGHKLTTTTTKNVLIVVVIFSTCTQSSTLRSTTKMQMTMWCGTHHQWFPSPPLARNRWRPDFCKRTLNYGPNMGIAPLTNADIYNQKREQILNIERIYDSGPIFASNSEKSREYSEAIDIIIDNKDQHSEITDEQKRIQSEFILTKKFSNKTHT